MYVLGQICGLIGTVVTIATPQFRTKQQILLCNAIVNALNAMNFTLIGQGGSAVFLCLVAIVQSFVSIWHERKQKDILIWESVMFFVLYIGFGVYGMITSDGFVWALTLHNFLQLLPIIGALMLMLAVFAKGEQKTRVYLLLNGASWFIYTAAIGSTAFFSTVAFMISSIIALWKYRDKGDAKGD